MKELPIGYQKAIEDQINLNRHKGIERDLKSAPSVIYIFPAYNFFYVVEKITGEDVVIRMSPTSSTMNKESTFTAKGMQAVQASFKEWIETVESHLYYQSPFDEQKILRTHDEAFFSEVGFDEKDTKRLF